jgi:hypothetical protein
MLYFLLLACAHALAWHVGPNLLPGLTVAGGAAFIPGAPPIATGTFSDTIYFDGWSRLQITTNASSPEEEQAFAAGFLEAHLTAEKIFQGVVNTGANFSWPPALEAFLAANDAWVRGMVASNGGSAYWHHVGLVYAQLDGLLHGYAAATNNTARALPLRALFNVNLGGDMEDLSSALNLTASPRASARAAARAAAVGAPRAGDTEGGGHCSALVRLLPGFSEVFFAQATWAGFEDMTRILKEYDFPWTTTGRPGDPRVPATRVVFSSDPASLFSGDDFYVLGSGLAMLETTIGNNNATLYQLFVSPHTVLEWVRNIVANRLAATGAEWVDIYTAHNSGTYNNENIIADFKLFTPGEPPKPGFLWAADQIPGSVEARDITDELVSVGYVASYNVARFPKTYNASGMFPLFQKYGPWFSFHDTARANIFRRDAPKAADEQSVMALMRYNDFENDPLSRQACTGYPPSSAENAVAARDDLNPADGVYPFAALSRRDHAAIDAKLTSSARMRGGGGGGWALGAAAVAGPTWGSPSCPVFRWSTSEYNGLPHLGHPDAWNFTWVDM